MEPPPLPPETPRRDRGTECLLSNLAFPGLGSYRAGAKKIGVAQMVGALAGFFCTNAFALWFAAYWFQNGVNPAAMISETYVATGQWPAKETRTVVLGLAGIGVFLVSLAWALLFSLAVRKRLNAEELVAEGRPPTGS